MNYENCNEEEVKKTKRWCGPGKYPRLNRLIPQLFPCACRVHDFDYSQKQTISSAVEMNDKFFLNMIKTTKNKKLVLKPFYYLIAFVYYFMVFIFIPFYYVFRWRKME